MEADGPQPGSGGVFGRRAGRRLRVGQAALMRDLLPGIEIDLDRAGSLAALFEGGSELRLEIGFGGGEHLAHHARRRPEARFIGCEPFRNGVAKFLEQAAAADLENVKLFIGDAGVLIERLPDAVLAGVDLFYPDPWPKRRQRKRRFVSAGMLDRLARVMRPGAALRFATDIDDYAGWTLARIASVRPVRLDGPFGRGLVAALGGLAVDPLRGQSPARGTPASLPELRSHRRETPVPVTSAAQP